jgi:regulator of protease activity HflC (stomatin/prohibitin superfamily)
MSNKKIDPEVVSLSSFFLKVLYSILLIAALSGVIFGMKKVDVTEIGVKINRISLPPFFESGIVPKSYSAGYVFTIPVIQTLDVIDTQIHSLELSKSYAGPSMGGDKALEIRTHDESTVHMDVTVFYQIDRDKAYIFWANVAKGSGHAEDYYTQVVATLKSELRDQLHFTLGAMGRDEFYNASEKRESLALAAKDQINRKFEIDHLGIKLVDILIRDFNYSKDYEEKILDKSLTEQFALVEQSRVKVEEVRKVLNAEIIATGEARVKIIEQEGLAEEMRIHADADLYYTQQIAEGDLAIQNARAVGEKALSKAFKGEGGEIAVAIEMAKRLENLNAIILQSGGKNGVNPLDVDAMRKLFGVKK